MKITSTTLEEINNYISNIILHTVIKKKKGLLYKNSMDYISPK